MKVFRSDDSVQRGDKEEVKVSAREIGGKSTVALIFTERSIGFELSTTRLIRQLNTTHKAVDTLGMNSSLRCKKSIYGAET